MSFFKNKFVIAVTAIVAVILILMGISGLTGGKSSPVAGTVRIIFSPAQKLVSKVSGSINNFTVFIWEMRGYKTENERLVSEINQLKKENRSISDYKTENDRLKELLDLKNQISNYETVAARVVAYGANNWYNLMEIDRGTKDGLEIENVVITADGVVGQITEIGSNWAKVSTITDPEHALGVRVVRTGDIAITEGDLLLSRDGQCKMTFISKDAMLVAGDVLETSGLGGIYPAGLSVGKVREIKSDNVGTLEYAVIEPFVDFGNIHEVLVIKTTAE